MNVSQCALSYVLLAIAASYITFTVCSAGITASTRVWIREMAQHKKIHIRLPFHHMARLVGCPFCTGFWAVTAIEAVTRVNVFPIEGWVWHLLTIPALTMPAAMLAFVGSLMVGQVHKAIKAMEEADEKIMDERRNWQEKHPELEIPESLRLTRV